MTAPVEPMTAEEEACIRARDNLPSMRKALATIDALRAELHMEQVIARNACEALVVAEATVAAQAKVIACADAMRAAALPRSNEGPTRAYDAARAALETK